MKKDAQQLFSVKLQQYATEQFHMTVIFFLLFLSLDRAKEQQILKSTHITFKKLTLVSMLELYLLMKKWAHPQMFKI